MANHGMAVTGYREVPRRQTLRGAFYHGALERLEPDEVNISSPVLCATKYITVMLERQDLIKSVEPRAFPNDLEANSAGEGQGGTTRLKPEGTSGKGQDLIQTRRPPA